MICSLSSGKHTGLSTFKAGKRGKKQILMHVGGAATGDWAQVQKAP